MLLKNIVLAAIFTCLSLPAWAIVTAPATGSTDSYFSSLEISTDVNQKSEKPLARFIQKVWLESPTVQAAQAAVDAAQARVESADQPLYNPALSLEAERTDINSSSIGFSQTIDWHDKRGALTDIAGQKVQMALVDLTATRQRIATEALDALVRYLTAKELQHLALRRSQLMKHFSDTVKQRRAAGDMLALDASLAQVAYSEALMEQASSEGDLAEAEAALQAIGGFDFTAWPQLPQSLAPPPQTPDVAALLESLPELAVLRGRLNQARTRIQLAKREGRADPTISVRGGREDTETLLGLSLEIPLFIRNNYQSEVRVASHEAVEEELHYREAYRRARARLKGSLGRFENTTRAWRAWVATGQHAHREQMSLLEKMWQVGELSATDYLIQAKQNIDTQAAAMALVGDVWRAAFVWLAASGQVEEWLGVSSSVSIEITNSGEQKQ